jgi:hypothetical protein
MLPWSKDLLSGGGPVSLFRAAIMAIVSRCFPMVFHRLFSSFCVASLLVLAASAASSGPSPPRACRFLRSTSSAERSSRARACCASASRLSPFHPDTSTLAWDCRRFAFPPEAAPLRAATARCAISGCAVLAQRVVRYQCLGQGPTTFGSRDPTDVVWSAMRTLKFTELPNKNKLIL